MKPGKSGILLAPWMARGELHHEQHRLQSNEERGAALPPYIDFMDGRSACRPDFSGDLITLFWVIFIGRPTVWICARWCYYDLAPIER